MKLIFAGGAREVGGSCIYVRANSYGILMDAGIRQSAVKDPLPDFRAIQEAGGVDAILISHAHLDHTGSLPVISRAYPQAKIYMTSMTMQLTGVLLQDSLKIMDRREEEIPHYNADDVAAMMQRIVPVPWLSTYELNEDFSFTFYPAGHIAGASCISLNTPEGNIFYSGDVSLFAQRTIEGARIPRLRPDIGIFESTYGNRLHSNREAEEQRLIDTVRECAEKGYKVLIPSFALGRAQEVLLILKSAVQKKALPEIPVYVDGMIRDINRVYQGNPLYLKSMNARRINKGEDLFASDCIREVSRTDDRSALLKTEGPAIFVSSSGMLTGGPSMLYAEQLIPDEHACIIITGYQDEEAPGRMLLDMMKQETDKKVTLNGKVLPLRCQVEQVGLSAHSDKSELIAMVDRLSPRRIFLVHGDEEAMNELGNELSSDYRRQIYEPSCGSAINIEVTGKRKQLSSALPYTLHQTSIEPDDLKQLRSFWLEHYPTRSFTIEEITSLSTGKTMHPAHRSEEENQLLQNMQNALEKTPYFERDPRRLFLFRPVSDADLSEAIKANEPDMHDVEAVLTRECTDLRIRRYSYHQEVKQVELVLDYPDTLDPERLKILQDIVRKETGWTLSLSSSFNHQMASLYLQQLFPGRISKVSHFDQKKIYTVRLINAEDADAQKQQEFHQTTGWTLTFAKEGIDASIVKAQPIKDTKGWYFPKEPGKPMEQNNAFCTIDYIFRKESIQPYKKGLRVDQDGKFYDLSFLSPVIAEQCASALQQCADEIHLPVHIADSVNQNAIQTILMQLCEKYGIAISKTPSWLPAKYRFELRTEQELPQDMIDEFKTMTGLDLSIKQK